MLCLVYNSHLLLVLRSGDRDYTFIDGSNLAPSEEGDRTISETLFQLKTRTMVMPRNTTTVPIYFALETLMLGVITLPVRAGLKIFHASQHRSSTGFGGPGRQKCNLSYPHKCIRITFICMAQRRGHKSVPLSDNECCTILDRTMISPGGVMQW